MRLNLLWHSPIITAPALAVVISVACAPPLMGLAPTCAPPLLGLALLFSLALLLVSVALGQVGPCRVVSCRVGSFLVVFRLSGRFGSFVGSFLVVCWVAFGRLSFVGSFWVVCWVVFGRLWVPFWFPGFHFGSHFLVVLVLVLSGLAGLAGLDNSVKAKHT
jgi:hypothetical protein